MKVKNYLPYYTKIVLQRLPKKFFVYTDRHISSFEVDRRNINNQ